MAVFWPNQGEGDRGVHVNVSGAGVTKYARNIIEALSLLEFLVTDESQEWYAEVNNEYPVVEGAKISKTLESFGTFKADSINLTILGVNNPAAVKLMDRIGPAGDESSPLWAAKNNWSFDLKSDADRLIYLKGLGAWN